jgi:hypothetical protein
VVSELTEPHPAIGDGGFPSDGLTAQPDVEGRVGSRSGQGSTMRRVTSRRTTTPSGMVTEPVMVSSPVQRSTFARFRSPDFHACS